MFKKIAFAAVAVAFVASPIIASAETIDELQARLNSLLSQLTGLRAQIEGLGGTATLGGGSGKVFLTSPLSGSAPLLVTFGIQNDEAVSIDFGDGSTNTCAGCGFIRTATHIYGTPGSYTVKYIEADNTVIASSTVTVSGAISTSSIAISLSQRTIKKGQVMNIAWASNLGSSTATTSAVGLFLVSGSNAAKGVIASERSLSGSFAWTVSTSTNCAVDSTLPCGIIPGTYQIVAKLYTPSNACLAGLCPLNSQATILASATSSSIVIGAEGSASSTCAALSRGLAPDDTDETTGGDVSRLQIFLALDPAIYPEALVTGYYGPATTRAVQRWQKARGIVSSGTPDSTGYGAVGPRTRAAMGCGENASIFSATPTSGTAPLTVSFKTGPLDTSHSYVINLGNGTSTVAMQDPAAAQCTASSTSPCTRSYVATHTYTSGGTFTALLQRVEGVDDEDIATDCEEGSACAGISAIANAALKTTLASVKVTVTGGTSPVNPNGTTPTRGFIDAIGTCEKFEGWAQDPDDASASIAVHFYMDGPAGSGTFAGSAMTNVERPDVNAFYSTTGKPGWSWSVPTQYRSGQHTVYAYALDTRLSSNNSLLSLSPRTFRCDGQPVVCPAGETLEKRWSTDTGYCKSTTSASASVNGSCSTAKFGSGSNEDALRTAMLQPGSGASGALAKLPGALPFLTTIEFMNYPGTDNVPGSAYVGGQYVSAKDFLEKTVGQPTMMNYPNGTVLFGNPAWWGGALNPGVPPEVGCNLQPRACGIMYQCQDGKWVQRSQPTLEQYFPSTNSPIDNNSGRN